MPTTGFPTPRNTPTGREPALNASRKFPCQGTIGGQRAAIRLSGLSPRVWGNRDRGQAAGRHGGSIPACAGEPDRSVAASLVDRVYPRVCGGTGQAAMQAFTDDGLSPRVRGNLTFRSYAAAGPRSIPTCAGEPGSGVDHMKSYWVYPHVCGGTGRAGIEQGNAFGLSPRVRGNHFGILLQPVHCGSIPTCAGEPPTWASCRPPRKVYPHVCGGTQDSGDRQS